MAPLDIAALAFFAVTWLAYEPMLKVVSHGTAINTEMTVVRQAWMRNMARREVRLMDGQLLGQALNSASFFASSNLLLIAAVAGVLFSGADGFRAASSLIIIETSTRLVFEGKLALVLVALTRGLLDFIWSIRQMNYCLAAVGAAPDPEADPVEARTYGDAAARLLNPALSSFNAGVRGYYFALAAAAWMFGPIAFGVATGGAVFILFWRQRRSRAAAAVSELRRLIETRSDQP